MSGASCYCDTGDLPAMYARAMVRARKPHHCAECGHRMRVGEVHEAVAAAARAPSFRPWQRRQSVRRFSSRSGATIIGALVLGLALWLEFGVHPPVWVHVLLWPPLVAGLTLGGLRVSKAALLAAEVQRKAREASGDDLREED